MKENITISAVVPMYNASQWIEQLISDLKNQTFTKFEVILVDDGSTDQTYAISQRAIADDPRFTIIKKKNGGPGSARNLGIKHASGEYLRFLDSDDRIQENSFELLVAPALADPTIDLVIGRMIHEREYFQSELSGSGNSKEFMRDFSQDFYGIFYGVCHNKMYKKTIIKEHNLTVPEDIRWCEDYLFNLSYYAFAENFYYIDKEVYTYLIQDGSLVSQVPLETRNQIENLCIRQLSALLTRKKSWQDKAVEQNYLDATAYLRHSQMCNLAGEKVSFERFKTDCLNSECVEFWRKYPNRSGNKFYQVIKIMIVGNYYLLYQFMKLKEKLKKKKHYV